ncbi:hypothetical protein [Zooshikella ganghwensis]|uniref:hypothetical protein n=1 Tax=Zooshikella ganghwensis TaxID=202772 RepID=UPI0013FE43B2|nr:hypothetical protein [Zooshikella ganghwensis]
MDKDTAEKYLESFCKEKVIVIDKLNFVELFLPSVTIIQVMLDYRDYFTFA